MAALLVECPNNDALESGSRVTFALQRTEREEKVADQER